MLLKDHVSPAFFQSWHYDAYYLQRGLPDCLFVAAPVNAGDYVLTADGLSAANYAIRYQDGKLAITPKALTVTVQDASKTYDGVAFSGGNGVVYSGFVNGESSTDLGGSLVYGGDAQGAVNAGRYTLTASGLVSANYAIDYVDGDLVVDPKQLAISLAGQSKSYDGSTAIALSGDDFVINGLVNGESVSIQAMGQYNSKDVLAADSVTVLLQDSDFADGSGGFVIGNYRYDSELLNTESAIVAADLQVKVNDVSRVYDGSAFDGQAGLTLIGLASGETLADLDGTLVYSGSAVGAKNVGSYVSIADGLSSSNYNIRWQSGTLAITPKTLQVSVADVTRVYDATAYSGGDVSFSGFVEGEDAALLQGELRWTGNAERAVNAGSYQILGEGLSAANYQIEWQSGTLEITPAALTIAVNAAQKTYDGIAFSGGNGISISGFVGDDTIADLHGELVYGGDAQGAVNAGSYSLAASGLVSGNYSIDWQAGELLIDRRQLSVTLTAQLRDYNGSEQSLVSGSDFIVGNLVNGETVAINDVIGSWNSRNVSDADAVTVMLSEADLVNAAGGFVAGNYRLPDAVTNSNSLIQPVALDVTANDVVRHYDGQPFSGGNGVTLNGLQGDDSLSDLGGTLVFGGDSQGAIEQGEYVITPGGLTSDNYVLAFHDGLLNITVPLTASQRADRRTGLAMLDRLAMHLPQGLGLSAGAITGTGQQQQDCRIDCNALSHVSSLDNDDGSY